MRHRHAGDDRHIGGLDAAIGEIDRGRALGGARNADQHHVGAFEVVGVLPVVMQHGVVERVDALEIFGIEHVLGADPRGRFGAEIGLQQAQDRTEDRQARQTVFAALALEAPGQIRIEQRIEHDAGRGLDLAQHTVELLLRAHQRIDMLDRRHIGILRGSRARDRDQRLAGRIRNEMKMEIAGLAMSHRHGTDVETWGEGHVFWRSASQSGRWCALLSTSLVVGIKLCPHG